MHDPVVLQAKLKTLSDSYAEQLPELLKQLEQALSHIPTAVWDELDLQTILRLVHGLVGSGKTFGFATLSDKARKLETYLKQIVQAKSVISNDQRNHLQESMRELHQAAIYRDASFIDQSGLIAVAQPGQNVVASRRIFVVEDEHALAEELKVQLGYFGYDVSVFNTLADFRLALQQTPDVVVLMDVSFPEDRLGGVKTMKEIQLERDVPLPVVFLSAVPDVCPLSETKAIHHKIYLTNTTNR